MPINFDLSGLPDKPDSPSPSGGRGMTFDLSGLPDKAEPTAMDSRQSVLSEYKGPPSWDQLSWFQKMTMLTNPHTMGYGIREMTRRDPAEDQARTMNILSMADRSGLSPSFIDRNYDKLIKDPEITGIQASGPRKGAAGLYDVGEALGQMFFPALIGGGLVTAPVSTLIGLGTFMGAAEGLKYGAAKATGQEYQFGMAAHELLPLDSSENIKAMTDAAEFLGSALVAGKIIQGWNKVIPAARETITERLFRDVITEQRFPDKVYISPEKVRAMQTGEFAGMEADLVKELGLTGPQWRQALRMGVDLEVPAERIVRIIDKPWWKKFKESAPEFMRLSPYEDVRVFTEGRAGGQARPSGLLPAPEGGLETPVAGAVEFSGFPPSPTPSGSETLNQASIRQPIEALNRIREQIVKAGFGEEYADTTARLLEARSRTWAVQTGKDPAEYFERWGLDFERGWLPGKRRARMVKKPTGRDAAETLIGWIKTQGGLWDESLPGKMRQFGGKEAALVGLLSKVNGQTFAKLTEAAIEDGWLPDGSQDIDFINLVSRDVRAVKEGGTRVERMESTRKADEALEAKETEYLDAQQGRVDQLTAEGWNVLPIGSQIPIADLNPGDRLMVYGEEFVHKGFDEKGNAILEDGEVITADLFDRLPAEAVKGEGAGTLFQMGGGSIREQATRINKAVAEKYQPELDRITSELLVIWS